MFDYLQKYLQIGIEPANENPLWTNNGYLPNGLRFLCSFEASVSSVTYMVSKLQPVNAATI